MRTIIFSLFLVLISTQVQAQKIITNPKIGMSNEPKLKITQIEMNETETILSFHASYPTGSGIGIRLKSFIQIVGQPDSLFMTKQDTPPKDATGWIPIPEGGLKYKLHFPPIDPGTSKIDFGEPDAKGWKIFDIEINEYSNNSILPKELLGHWFSPNNGNWVFSFLDSVAAYENKAWEYVSALLGENVTEVKLKSGDEEKTLYCRADGKNFCFMHTDDLTLIRYSRDSGLQSNFFDDEAFKAPIIEPGIVHYSGVINGFTTRLGTSTGIIRFFNRLNNQQESHLIKVKENGVFSVEFLLDFPQELSVKLPSGTEQVFFEPGKSLFQLVNSGLPDYSSLYMGKSAAVNLGLIASKDVGTPTMAFIDEILEMTDEEYIEYVVSVKNKELEKLKSIQKKQKISLKTFQIRMMDIEFRAAKNAVNFNQHIRLANFYANRKVKKDEQKPFIPKRFDLKLLTEINDTPVDGELAYVSSEYFNLLQALKYTDFERPQGAYHFLISVLGAELEKQGKELNGEEKDMLDFIRISLIEAYDDNGAKNFNKSYGKVLQDFRKKHVDLFTTISNDFYSQNIEKNSSAIFGFPGDKLVEINSAQKFLMTQNKASDLLEDDFKNTKQSIKNEVLKEFVISEYYKKKAEIEVRNSAGGDELKTEGDKLFHSIVSKFKGKVIYVDFWATWCGPCIAGIERIKSLKEELKEEDIVFVYITNPTSPDKTYKEMVPDIKGEHHKVSSDEWNYLTQKFNIYGIPHYALVDKNGKIVNAHMMHLGNDELKKALMEQVNK